MCCRGFRDLQRDHYSYAETTPGSYELTEDTVGTRYTYLTVRTFFDPDDIEGTHALQDGLRIEVAATARSTCPTDVNISNFTRAETDLAIARLHGLAGGFGNWFHIRQPTPIDQQPVIRMNHDTLYSGAVVDLSRPATVHLPETGGRYQSLSLFASSGRGRAYHAARVGEPNAAPIPTTLTQLHTGTALLSRPVTRSPGLVAPWAGVTGRA